MVASTQYATNQLLVLCDARAMENVCGFSILSDGRGLALVDENSKDAGSPGKSVGFLCFLINKIQQKKKKSVNI